ncbi:murein L,D-transpeptidase catalytic domain-containing protein [Flavobacterium flavipallidum]|uniref:Murein L,D-transpeptidase catalytic domain-containing protein n=1 Tax=Flavobacterium flavipallidum TaxID=3139140 RepID=A0ABU9HPN5_9FLAO
MRDIIIGVFAIVILCGFGVGSKSLKNLHNESRFEVVTKEERISEQIVAIKSMLKSNPKFNNEIVFLLDMKIMSGKNRFFVYDLIHDKIIDQGLVAHGLGSGMFSELKFSDENNSHCTSLGKYYIGKSYFGEFGKAYKLHGLEATNNNAFLRNIVLHKYNKVPYEEQKTYICNSLGCPMVNEIYYSRIQKFIDNSKSNIILDIYY